MDNIEEKDDLEYIDMDKVSEEAQKQIDLLNPHKFASCKFIYKEEIEIYRFDLWTTEYKDEELKLIQLKAIINNFNAIRPDNMKKVRPFFAIVGLVRFVFPKTMFEVPKETKEKTIVLTLERTVNKYIKYAKLKGLKFTIDTEE